jgi:sugar O-acyltransferase (sialic acid O-acetyltransferase NeuD family)
MIKRAFYQMNLIEIRKFNSCNIAKMNETEIKKIVVFGIGDFARQVTFYFKNDSNFEIVAYTVDAKFNNEKSFLDLPVVDFEQIHEKYPPEKYEMFIAIGFNKLNKTREVKFKEAKTKGYKLVSYICSKNFVWNDLEIGENCFIMEGNVIQLSVKISDNVIICIGNRIGHNGIIEENCFITSGVMIGGFSRIKKNTFIGLNSTIKSNIIIEENNILGAGSIILKNTIKNSSYLTTSTPAIEGKNRIIMNLL